VGLKDFRLSLSLDVSALKCASAGTPEIATTALPVSQQTVRKMQKVNAFALSLRFGWLSLLPYARRRGS
jgi:hypothetical protein